MLMTLKLARLLIYYASPVSAAQSDILGRDAFMEAATDLTQRLYLGECAAALARYIDESSNTIKPVGTINYL